MQAKHYGQSGLSSFSLCGIVPYRITQGEIGMSVTTIIPVTIGDINYGNHMGNDRFLTFFHEARLAFLREIQASELSIGQGIGLIMTEAAVRYLSQVVHGDILEVLVCVIEVKKTSFVLQYKAFRQQDGCQVAVGTTTLCAFDYTSMKIARLPEPFRQSLLDQMTTN